MAMLCPQCNMPMSSEEARAGACPVCAAPLQSATPAPAPEPAPPPKSSRALPWAICGASAVCLLLAVLFFSGVLSGKPEEDEPEDSRAADRKQPAGEEPAPRKDARAEETKPAKTTASPAQPEKPAVKQPETKKPEEVKPPIKKPEEPKPPAPEPMPMLPFKGQRFTTLPLLSNSAITIDGDLSDWQGIQPLLLTAVDRVKGHKKTVAVPKTQKAYAAYCPNGILVAVDAIDTSGELENQPVPKRGTWPFWDNDALEIFIDTLNSRVHERGDLTAHQFFVLPFGPPNGPSIGGYESKIINRGRKQDWTIVPLTNTGADALMRAGRKTRGGWALECLIPKSALRQAEFKPGAIFGFELQLGTGTSVYYCWACDNPLVRVSMHPDFWGEVFLAGSDARIELLDAARKPVQSFLPGKPLTVRVTDADINLDPAKKEKVSVTLRSRSGDVKALALEETAPDSGVFAGAIPTRLNTGGRADKVFEVVEGESISVEYVDQLRGNGERNKTLRASFAVGPSRTR